MIIGFYCDTNSTIYINIWCNWYYYKYIMSGNTFGKIFTVTTCGESHGDSLAAIIDGCPANIELSEKDIQIELDRRKPGQFMI